MSIKRFNLRVYGICINENNEILLSDEQYVGRSFTKFPGGGVEWGEGFTDCLKREFKEEFDLDVEVGELFYLTDFFQASAFSEHDQIVSIYYRVQLPEIPMSFPILGDKDEQLRWHSLSRFCAENVTFPIDKHVAQLIIDTFNG